MEKPFTIGIMTGSFYQDYSRMIVDAICDRLQGEYIQVYLFQGFDAGRFLNNNAFVDDSFDMHYYSMFEYSRFVDVDLLIISIGTISAVSDPLPLKEFLSKLPQVPVIVMEDEADIENVVCITVDNYNGMKNLVEHLITVHDCKKLVYVSGPKNVPDSMLRMKAFLDAMNAHALPVTEDSIVYGDFTDQIDDLVEELLAKNPEAEAVVCANDEMAECTYRVIRSKGLTPGKDILVTGFDDNDSAPYMNPPLTTVRQDFSEVAAKAASMVLQVVHRKKIFSETIPAKFMIRSSCGCAQEVEDTAQLSEVNRLDKVFEERSKVKTLQNQGIISALTLRGVLKQDISTKDFFLRLGEILHRIGAHRSYIALLREPMCIADKKRMFLPEKLKLFMSQREDEVVSYNEDDAPTVQEAGLQKYMGETGIVHKQMAAFPLFSGEYHYGVFFVELPRKNMLFYYTISLEIGTGIRYLLLSHEAQAAHRALEEKNQILDYSARHDSLTGLFNRAGVMSNAFAMLQNPGENSHFVAVMADLDHLKQINDTFGHNVGDEAIKKTAEILREVLPEESVLGRTGGDEFVCFMHRTSEEQVEKMKRRVKELCEIYNGTSLNPYYLGISLGCYEFDAKEDSRLNDVLKQADVLLYEAKKSRRSNVIR